MSVDSEGPRCAGCGRTAVQVLEEPNSAIGALGTLGAVACGRCVGGMGFSHEDYDDTPVECLDCPREAYGRLLDDVREGRIDLRAMDNDDLRRLVAAVAEEMALRERCGVAPREVRP